MLASFPASTQPEALVYILTLVDANDARKVRGNISVIIRIWRENCGQQRIKVYKSWLFLLYASSQMGSERSVVTALRPRHIGVSCLMIRGPISLVFCDEIIICVLLISYRAACRFNNQAAQHFSDPTNLSDQ